LTVKVRGIRGAITVAEDREIDIIEATYELIRTMVEENQVEASDVASVWITVTEELRSTFPAKALRRMEGWCYVPVMCSTEIPVPGSISNCIRVMMHVNTTQQQEEIRHIYLRDAIKLRPDLHLTLKNNMR